MTPFHRATMLGLASLGLLALAACTTTSPNYGYGNQGSSYPSQTRCADCGIVTRIDVLASTRSAPAATGTVLASNISARCTRIGRGSASMVLPQRLVSGLVCACQPFSARGKRTLFSRWMCSISSASSFSRPA